MTPREAEMDEDPIRVTEAARRLDITTRQVLVLIRERRIEYVMQDGIAHIPVDAIARYLAKAS